MIQMFLLEYMDCMPWQLVVAPVPPDACQQLGVHSASVAMVLSCGPHVRGGSPSLQLSATLPWSQPLSSKEASVPPSQHSEQPCIMHWKLFVRQLKPAAL